jgi:hypothetical protein
VKFFRAALYGLLVIPFVAAGCSHSAAAGPIQVSLSSDGVAATKTIEAYWAAFNSYDLNAAVSYLDPIYAQTRASGVKDEINQFQAGRSLGVKMNVTEVTQAGVLPDGRLDLRVTMTITPKGLQNDKHLVYYMLKEPDGTWKISLQNKDGDKDPPSAPDNDKLIAVSPTEVDITWTDTSTVETGYRIDRALDDNFTVELSSVTLPANSTSYVDTTVKPGTKYWYRVIAFDKGGDSFSPNWPVMVPSS